MPQSIKEVMTPNPTTLPLSATAEDAAKKMRDENIGDVLVVDDEQILCGIVTDRDIALQVVAAGVDPKALRLDDIASKDVASLPPGATVETAARVMRDKAVRRLPIVDRGKPVGVVSLGDLAIERDPDSALAVISSAPPDRPENGKVTPRAAAFRAARVLPAAACGALLAVSVEQLRERSRRRNTAARRLQKATKKLRKAGDRVTAGPAGRAAQYAGKRVEDVRKRIGAG